MKLMFSALLTLLFLTYFIFVSFRGLVTHVRCETLYGKIQEELQHNKM